MSDTTIKEQLRTPSHTLGLLFHPDLLFGTPLGKTIGGYHFFDYDSAESLHLSERERRMYTDTLSSIRSEMELPVDKHSQTILTDASSLSLTTANGSTTDSLSLATGRAPISSRFLSATSKTILSRDWLYVTACPQWPTSPVRPVFPLAISVISSARKRV